MLAFCWMLFEQDGQNTALSCTTSVLNCTQTDTEDDHPILCREVEAAIQSLKKGKSTGVDNIPAELVQAGGEDVITALTTICDKIWQTGKWPTPFKPPSKLMLKIILNRLKSQAGTIIAEQQAGFRAERSTTEQIFNLRILCEKYLQHQQDLYHIFIDFKKAFDRVWHAALWATMKQYNISADLIRDIKNLYDKATSAAPFTAA